MNTLISVASTNRYLSGLRFLSPIHSNTTLLRFDSTPPIIRTNFSHFLVRGTLFVRAASDEVETQTVNEELTEEQQVESNEGSVATSPSTSAAPIDKELKKAVQKTASTFAPRASTATKSPAVPGTALYTVFEV